jgi:rSAM/selenodomain-associated transferase 1
MTRGVQLLVMAKTPVAGRVKTRLCPPLTPVEAARVAEAALADTLEAVAATRAARRVLVLDGPAGAWLPRGIEVVPQRGGGLDERLAFAFGDAGAPALLIGMDTPQVTPGLLEFAIARLAHSDAVLGPARDGGYWAIGLTRADPAVFLDVPMSVPHTAVCQRARLASLGLKVAELPALTDVDTFEDACAVASDGRPRRFAVTIESLAVAAS